MSKKLVLILVIVGGVLVLGVVCCFVGAIVTGRFVSEETGEKITENIIEEAIENETGGDVDVEIDANNDEGSIHFEDEDSSLDISSDQEWPDEIPSYIPEFKYGEMISNVYSGSGTEGEGWVLGFQEVGNSAFDDYKDELEGKGWTVATETEASSLKMLTVTKGDDIISVSCDTADDTAVISVSIDK